MSDDIVWKLLIWLLEWGFILILFGFYITAMYP
jgi:hypothetical protein